MNDKILCPYCGSVMVRGDCTFELYYVCPNCDSESPIVSPFTHTTDTKEELWECARIEALRRFTPMQKPMTAEMVLAHIESESYRPLYMEYNPNGERWKSKLFWDTMWRDIDCVKLIMKNISNEYDVELRFWWEQPTDEEISEAPWGTDDERRAEGWEETQK